MTCKSVHKDHNGNKRDHSLFFVSSLVVIGKPYEHCNVLIFYIVLILCILTLCMHCCVLTRILLICDTEINQSINHRYSVCVLFCVKWVLSGILITSLGQRRRWFCFSLVSNMCAVYLSVCLLFLLVSLVGYICD